MVAGCWVVQVLAALFVLVPLCYLTGAFTINPVVEEASQAHHLQLLSGCPPFIYWAGSYVRLTMSLSTLCFYFFLLLFLSGNAVYNIGINSE